MTSTVLLLQWRIAVQAGELVSDWWFADPASSSMHVMLQGECFMLCIYKASHAAPMPCLSMHAQTGYVWQHCTSFSCQHLAYLQ